MPLIYLEDPCKGNFPSFCYTHSYPDHTLQEHLNRYPHDCRLEFAVDRDAVAQCPDQSDRTYCQNLPGFDCDEHTGHFR